MLGLGFGEIFVVAIVLLVAVGPKRLPTLMRAVGKALREFRKGAFELRQASGIDQMMNEDLESIRRPLKEIRPSLHALSQEKPLETTATPVQGSSEEPETTGSKDTASIAPPEEDDLQNGEKP